MISMGLPAGSSRPTDANWDSKCNAGWNEVLAFVIVIVGSVSLELVGFADAGLERAQRIRVVPSGHRYLGKEAWCVRMGNGREAEHAATSWLPSDRTERMTPGEEERRKIQ